MRSEPVEITSEITRLATRGGPLIVMIVGFTLAFTLRELTASIVGLALVLLGASVEMYVYLQRLRPQSYAWDGFRSGSVARLQSDVANIEDHLRNAMTQMRAEIDTRLTELFDGSSKAKIDEETIKFFSTQAALSYLDRWEKEICPCRVKTGSSNVLGSALALR